MNSLTMEQKKSLVDIAQKSYMLALEERKSNNDPYVLYDNNSHPLSESCYNISSLINYIAKNKYGISDENNKVYHCLIKFGEVTNTHTYSHFINKVCGEYIDASIEQFNHKASGFVFSAYENYEEYYKEIEEVEPINNEGIREEIEAYELLFIAIPQIVNRDRDKKQSFLEWLTNKIFNKSRGV